MIVFSHSDVHNIRGYTPMTTNVGGHEGVGRIVTGRDVAQLISESPA